MVGRQRTCVYADSDAHHRQCLPGDSFLSFLPPSRPPPSPSVVLSFFVICRIDNASVASAPTSVSRLTTPWSKRIHLLLPSSKKKRTRLSLSSLPGSPTRLPIDNTRMQTSNSKLAILKSTQQRRLRLQQQLESSLPSLRSPTPPSPHSPSRVLDFDDDDQSFLPRFHCSSSAASSSSGSPPSYELVQHTDAHMIPQTPPTEGEKQALGLFTTVNQNNQLIVWDEEERRVEEHDEAHPAPTHMPPHSSSSSSSSSKAYEMSDSDTEDTHEVTPKKAPRRWAWEDNGNCSLSDDECACPPPRNTLNATPIETTQQAATTNGSAESYSTQSIAQETNTPTKCTLKLGSCISGDSASLSSATYADNGKIFSVSPSPSKATACEEISYNDRNAGSRASDGSSACKNSISGSRGRTLKRGLWSVSSFSTPSLEELMEMRMYGLEEHTTE